MDISDIEREFLLGMRALTINDKGEEVYVGLTLEESLAFYELVKLDQSGELPGSQAEDMKKLQEKHETARQVIVEGKAPLHPSSQHHGEE